MCRVASPRDNEWLFEMVTSQSGSFLTFFRPDAIVHVVRCFEDEDVIHVDGTGMYQLILPSSLLLRFLQNSHSQIKMENIPTVFLFLKSVAMKNSRSYSRC